MMANMPWLGKMSTGYFQVTELKFYQLRKMTPERYALFVARHLDQDANGQVANGQVANGQVANAANGQEG